MFKVAIIGGEQTNNYEKFQSKCIFYLKNKAKEGNYIIIYTVGDKFVKKFAEKYGIATKTFYCDFLTYQKQALKVRAEKLLSDCDAVIAFRNDLKDIQIITKLANEKGLQVRKVI